LLNPEHPIVIIATPGRETEAATRLGRIGFDRVAGFLAEGLHSLKQRPDLTTITERLSAPFAAEMLSSLQPPTLIDVRTPHERSQKQIATSLGIPLNHLSDHLSELPTDRSVLVYCAGGYRSSMAASLLQSRGFLHVSEIAGGITGWEAAGLPVQTGHASV
jgi:hydroxyacylglutathione hydrolase